MKKEKKLIREGQYIAEVEVALEELKNGWSPCLSLEDAEKLDEVRRALKHNDIKKACLYASVFKLTPVDCYSETLENR